MAQSAGTSSADIGRQFEAVRVAIEDERRQTSEAMADLYDQSTREADSMFRQAADKFASIVHSMKQMASELHGELDQTRTELRRGVFELPQEAAESTAQMRKVIVDQIEALVELNRIVARHGKGLDVATAARPAPREDELALAAAAARPAPRPRDVASASSLPPPEFGPAAAPRRTDAPPMSPAEPRRWLSDLLNRTDTETDAARGRAPAARQGGNPLEALSLDIGRSKSDRDLAAEMWDRYQRGERKAFSKRLYTPAGQKTFDEVARNIAPTALQADRGPLHQRVRTPARRTRARRTRPRGAAEPPRLGNRAGLHLLAHAAGRLGWAPRPDGSDLAGPVLTERLLNQRCKAEARASALELLASRYPG